MTSAYIIAVNWASATAWFCQGWDDYLDAFEEVRDRLGVQVSRYNSEVGPGSIALAAIDCGEQDLRMLAVQMHTVAPADLETHFASWDRQRKLLAVHGILTNQLAGIEIAGIELPVVAHDAPVADVVPARRWRPSRRVKCLT